MNRIKLDALLAAGSPPEKAVYKTAGSLDLRLLVQKPEGWRSSDRRTAIVWIHGGAWVSGAPESFLPHCRYFAGRGAVCFSIQYRLAGNPDRPGQADSGFTVMDCVEDCKSAIRYIRRHADRFGIDPCRIVAAGDSAGGHLALSLATLREFDAPAEDLSVSTVPDAIVACNAIIDMTMKWKKYIPDWMPDGIQAEEDDDINKWWARHQLAQRLSPLEHIREGQPPLLIMHGLRDEVVPPEDAVRFFEVYRRWGNDAQLFLWPTARHAFICFAYTASNLEIFQALIAIDDFLGSLGLRQGEPTLELE